MSARANTESGSQDPFDALGKYPLLKAIVQRRSRRFGLGMELDGGPLAYQSRQRPVPLTTQEEAVLAFAAAGLTGHALGDLPYQPGKAPESGSGNMMFSLLGRSVASADALHAVSLFVLNDAGAYLVRRPGDLPRREIPKLLQLVHEGRFLEWYERSRIRVADGRVGVPRQVPYVPAFNKWAANVPGSTYLLPINDLTALYINVLLAMFSEEFGFFVLDERNGFAPAGVGEFARSRGGHLNDDPGKGRVATVQGLESWLLEFTAIEQGCMLQNLALAGEAMGLGGFPHFAAHPTAWFQALGFRIVDVPLSRTLGQEGPGIPASDPSIPVPVGLERNGEILIKAYCPPNYPTMEDAVRALVDWKFSSDHGVLRANSGPSAWRDPRRVQAGIPDYSDRAVAATVAYCEYIYRRYGRFPGAFGPFRTVLAHQAHHLDLDFYDRFYVPGTYTDAHKDHFRIWHGGGP